jgi:hypothetical protein
MLLHQWVLMLRELTDTNKLKFKDDTKRQTPTQDNFALPASIFKDTRKLSPKQVPGKGKVSTEQIHTGRSSVILVVTRKNRIFYICPDRESGQRVRTESPEREREREREREGRYKLGSWKESRETKKIINQGPYARQYSIRRSVTK